MLRSFFFGSSEQQDQSEEEFKENIVPIQYSLISDECSFVKSLAVAGFRPHTIEVFDYVSRVSEPYLKRSTYSSEHTGTVNEMIGFHFEGSYCIASSSADTNINITKLNSSAIAGESHPQHNNGFTFKLRDHKNPTYSLSFNSHSGSDRLVSSEVGPRIRYWNLQKRKCILEYTRPCTIMTSMKRKVRFLNERKLLIVAPFYVHGQYFNRRTAICIYDVLKQKMDREVIIGERFYSEFLDFSIDYQRELIYFVGNRIGEFIVLSLKNYCLDQVKKTIELKDTTPYNLTFNEESDYLVFSRNQFNNSKTEVVRLKVKELLARKEVSPQPITEEEEGIDSFHSCVYSIPNTTQVAVPFGDELKQVRIYDVKKRKHLKTIDVPFVPNCCVGIPNDLITIEQQRKDIEERTTFLIESFLEKEKEEEEEEEEGEREGKRKDFQIKLEKKTLLSPIITLLL